MMKRYGAFILFFLAAGWAFAQDMPPLPPMAGQDQAAASPSGSQAAPQPASDQQNGDNNGGLPALPPLPNQGQAAPSNQSPAEQTATPTDTPTTEAGSPAGAAPSTETASATTEATPTVKANAKKARKHAKKLKPWQVSRWRPGVIFGGWVTAKGGNETARLAWASQEIQNALLFHHYKFVKERGRYPGEQGGYQWREFTFHSPKYWHTVQVYIRQVGRKVWMRVGPSEPPAPAVYSLSQVRRMRQADLHALGLLRRKFGRRLAPRRTVGEWAAPYDYSKDEVVR